MKNLNAIMILATVAGMATLTACSSAKAEQVADTNESELRPQFQPGQPFRSCLQPVRLSRWNRR